MAAGSWATFKVIGPLQAAQRIAGKLCDFGAVGSISMTQERRRYSMSNKVVLHRTPTTLGDSGSLFSVTVSNAAGSVTSRNATLTVH